MLKISAVAVALATAATASGAASDVTREALSVRAKVSFTRVGPEYRALRLSITRAGRTWTSVNLGTTWYRPPKLTVRDLDADGEPEVGVDTYTGGAHCCDESRFFRYVPAERRYRMTVHSWGDVGYRVRALDGDGHPELVSADARFAYVFTSFALSYFPLQIWHFDRGHLRDVTRDYPNRIEREAKTLWATYNKLRRARDDVRGVLAAWLADEYLLRRANEGWKALEAANRRGELDGDAGWPSGSAYLRALRAFLVKTGYTH
jgi:hypothetical protein